MTQINVKDVAGEPHTVAFSEDRILAALWLDDFSEEDLDAIDADRRAATTFKDQLVSARKWIKRFVPGATDDDLARLTVRQIFELERRLMNFEISAMQKEAATGDVPLVVAGSTAEPSSLAS